MAVIHDVQPVRPVCAVTFAPSIHLEEVISRVSAILGPLEYKSAVYAFDYTAYYENEMGSKLSKVFLGFDSLMHPARLAFMKVMTNRLESVWSKDGCRQVNLDPAILSLARLVVASAKDFAHRIYIGEGIYGDLQLQYRHGEFHPHPWTFPDYQTEAAMQFFKQVRQALFNRIKQ